jgi:hypothetical protein
MQDFTFVIGMDADPADPWAVMGRAGITMVAACAFPRLEGRVMHVVVEEDDTAAGRQALIDAGYLLLDQRPVLVAKIEPKPGELGRLAKRVSDSGARINILYMALGNNVVIGADNLEKAAAAIHE